MKERSDVHWARKIWHMAGVSLMAAIYVYLPYKWAGLMLAISLICFVTIDIFRQKNRVLNEYMIQIFRPIMRHSEVHRLAGTTYLLLGVAVVVYFFPRDVVALTLLLLAFADPIASIVGIKYGKDKILGNKSLQGSLAAFFVCSVLTFGYMFYNVILLDRILIISLLVGLAGALAELIPIKNLDDNFTLPVVSGLTLWLLFTIFGA